MEAGVFVVKLCIALQFLLSSAPLHSYAKKRPAFEVVTESKPDVCNEFADDGDKVTVHYTGKLESGAIFDTSRQPNRTPLEFVLGQGKVIQGWESGIKGMCPGEKRKLTIPPELAYGANGFPPAIPPSATLLFETELVSLEKRGVSVDVIGDIIRLVQFLAVPAMVMYVIYYLYDKYQKAPTAKELKKSKRGKTR